MTQKISTGGPFAFSPSSSLWEPCSNTLLPNSENHGENPAPLRPGDILNVFTWNIDFGTPFARTRGITALGHIQERLSQPPYNQSVGTVILLQEVADPDAGPVFFRSNRDSSSLACILEDHWVRREFFTTDTTLPGTYGTLTLISKHIAVATTSQQPNESTVAKMLKSVAMAATSQQTKEQPSSVSDAITHMYTGCFRLPAPQSVMGRDILSVDLLLESGECLRISNVHLESLAIGTRIRPIQLFLVSQILREQNVSSGIVGGDMNAIDLSDFTLPYQENIQLKDVWVEYNGAEATLAADNENVGRKERQSDNMGPPTWGEEKGHTWGYQSGETIFYPRRMDKILFRVNEDSKAWIEPVEGGAVDRLGVNLNARIIFSKDPKKNDTSEESTEKQEEEDYLPVSDHFGLMTRFIVREQEHETIASL